MSTAALPVVNLAGEGFFHALNFLSFSPGGRILNIVGNRMIDCASVKGFDVNKNPIECVSFFQQSLGKFVTFLGHMQINLAIPYATLLASRVITLNPFLGILTFFSSVLLTSLPSVFLAEKSLSPGEKIFFQTLQTMIKIVNLVLSVFFLGKIGFILGGPVGAISGVVLALALNLLCGYFENKWSHPKPI